jgi:C1A family cysteine protease
MDHISKKPLTISMLFCLFFLSGPSSLQGQLKEETPSRKYEAAEQTSHKIDCNGANIIVADNRVYEMAIRKKEQFYSDLKSVGSSKECANSEDIGPLSQILDTVDLPSSFDWRNRDGRSYIGPVKNQNQPAECAACWAFGAVAAAEGTYNVAMGRYDNSVRFSESFLMWCLSSLKQYANPDGRKYFYGCEPTGTHELFEVQALVDVGIAYEAGFPYDIRPQECTHWQDPLVKFQSWHRIPCNNISAIKTAIMTYGPVVTGVLATEEFDKYDKNTVFEDTNTSCYDYPCYRSTTSHAVALVGWDDNGDPENNGYWILRNSMGAQWGDNGYMRIKYKAAHVACNAAYLVYSPAISPAVDLLLK